MMMQFLIEVVATATLREVLAPTLADVTLAPGERVVVVRFLP